MLIIPAIDLKDGRCVRLIQGDYAQETIFANDPVEIAQKWEACGAQLIHVVDLDGALLGVPKNIESIKRIIKHISIPIELGGGIRDMETIDQYLEIGVKRIILGTQALDCPEFIAKVCEHYPQKIIIGIDAKNNKVATQGWTNVSETSAIELAKHYEVYPLAAIIFTDIKRDGMLSGPNLESIKSIAQSVSVPIIASGGVSTYEDIKNICVLEHLGIEGIIIGKALYTGDIDLSKAISMVSEVRNKSQND